MRKIFDVVKIGWLANERRLPLYNHVTRRGFRFENPVMWVKPEKKPVYHPARSGDLAQFPAPINESVYLPFKDSKELEGADEKVKKVFSLGYQMPKDTFETYQNELVEKVKRHALDDSSEEVVIARLTAKIRYYQKIIVERPTKNGPLKFIIAHLIDRRRKKLKELRLKDYKKFEWLLEQLDLEFRSPVQTADNKMTRKKSFMLLARLKVEQTKEEKLAQLKKVFNEQKIPFLEKKLMQLRKIKEMEEKYDLPVTVKEEDIEECIKKMEEVKVEIEERMKKGYKRKIHPYFLEPFDENLLRSKEKAGELIREQMESEREKKLKESKT